MREGGKGEREREAESERERKREEQRQRDRERDVCGSRCSPRTICGSAHQLKAWTGG